MNKAVVAVLLLTLGVAMGGIIKLVATEYAQTKTLEQQSIEWLATPRSLVNFSLESEAGEFNNQSLMGRWTIVSFGFLSCPEVCPTSLMQLSILANSLSEQAIKQDIAFVFVSVDPRRDSIVNISEFVSYFDASFLGVTGSEEQLRKFTKRIGVRFKVSPDEDNYTVAHSVTFSIIDAEGVFRGRFSPGFDAPSLARDLTLKLSSLNK